MKKLIASFAVVALLFSASVSAQEVKKDKKTKTEKAEKKSCSASEKKGCCAAKKA